MDKILRGACLGARLFFAALLSAVIGFSAVLTLPAQAAFRFPSHAAPVGGTDFYYKKIGVPPGAGFRCRAGKLCMQRLRNGNTLFYDYTYDAKTNPEAAVDKVLVTDREGYESAALTYTYNVAGMLTSEKLVTPDHARTQTFHYDALDRLIEVDTTVDGKDGRTAYAYDANGNIPLERADAQKTVYAYNGLDEQVSRNGHILPGRYDARGSERYDLHGNRYFYNDYLQDITADTASGRYVYGYDPGGLRATRAAPRQHPGEIVAQYFSGDELLGAQDSADHDTSHYLLAGSRIERVLTDADGATVQNDYGLADYRDTRLGTLNGAGRFVSPQLYGAYGRKRHVTPVADPLSLAANPFGYDGEQHDAETGNIYLRARYTDGQGQFLTQDNVETMNRYQAFNGSPTLYEDKSGHLPTSALEWTTFSLQMAGGVFAMIHPVVGGTAFFLQALVGMIASYSASEKSENKRLWLGMAAGSTVSYIPILGVANGLVSEAIAEGPIDWGTVGLAAGINLLTVQLKYADFKWDLRGKLRNHPFMQRYTRGSLDVPETARDGYKSGQMNWHTRNKWMTDAALELDWNRQYVLDTLTLSKKTRYAYVGMNVKFDKGAMLGPNPSAWLDEPSFKAIGLNVENFKLYTGLHDGVTKSVGRSASTSYSTAVSYAIDSAKRNNQQFGYVYKIKINWDNNPVVVYGTRPLKEINLSGANEIVQVRRVRVPSP